MVSETSHYLSAKLEECDVIVQGLAVVVVMYVRGQHLECLRARRPVLTRQVVVSDAYVCGFLKANHTAHKIYNITYGVTQCYLFDRISPGLN